MAPCGLLALSTYIWQMLVWIVVIKLTSLILCSRPAQQNWENWTYFLNSTETLGCLAVIYLLARVLWRHVASIWTKWFHLGTSEMVVIWFYCASLSTSMWFSVGLPARNVPEHARSHNNTFLILEWTRIQGENQELNRCIIFKVAKVHFKRNSSGKYLRWHFTRTIKGASGAAK